jgi:hypothetical protein
MSTSLHLNPPDLDHADMDTVVDYFRSHLQQVVTLHTAMFQRLLFEGEGVPLELAELFDDAGNTYISLSESISKFHVQRKLSQIEEQLDAGVESALGRIKTKSRVKPRVRRTKHLAQPVKNKAHRTRV